ncbi:MAG TPA: rod shape-determining protein MreD [Synergistales bacterium]|nr:rod shape-determining protein MreD [Synergistales bacterium]
MMNLIALWYLQDLSQVLLSERFLAPDLFLFFLFYRVTKNPREASSVIWVALVAGLLWDFRWTALPGFTATAYASLAALFFIIWNHVPYSGRNAVLFSLLALAAQFFASLARFLFWGGFRGFLTGALAFQLFSAVPVIIAAALAAAAEMDEDNAGP